MDTNTLQMLPATPGTYALLIPLAAPLTLEVGRLGAHQFEAGWVVYIGSAHGPGGLRARVGRHLRHHKTVHWHIDHITTRQPVHGVWWCASSERLECHWSATCAGLSSVTQPVAGFGASDCGCLTHLFGVPEDVLHSLWCALKQPALFPPDCAIPSG